jgi:putative oxidoreductase
MSAAVVGLARQVIRVLELLSPALELAIRLYVARVFFLSGLTKIASWSTTLALFEDEYHVPLLPPELAAYLSTTVELTLPVFLALDLGGRFAAAILFVFNFIAATSYPDISPAGLKDHVLWGWLLAVVAFYGPGMISLDFLIKRRFFGQPS